GVGDWGLLQERFENFDNDHLTALASGTCLEGFACEFLVAVAVVLVGVVWLGWRWHFEQLSAAGELLLAAGITEKAVIPNTLEAFGENVDQEPADELLGSKCHSFVSVVIAIVLPAELNFVVIKAEQSVVGDGDAVGIACRVF